MNPYQDHTHRKDCGCRRPECVRLRALAEQLAELETLNDRAIVKERLTA